jgi:hypothetical protein
MASSPAGIDSSLAPASCYAAAMMRPLLIALLLVAACDKASPTSPTPKPDRLDVGEFPDNPLLASIPADTPYVFATFKPVSPDYIHKIVDVFGPIYHRAFDAYMAKSPEGSKQAAVFFELLGDVNAKRFDELGLSVKARFAVYGLAGGYPVMRLEIANGDRLIAFMQQVADRYHTQLPAPTQRGAWKLWRMPKPDKDWDWITAIGPKELVVSIAPANQLDADLATILGERKPAASLTTRQLRDLAVRDGFTGQGLGYVDLQRVAALADRDRSADCRDAITKLFAHAPRFAFGYRDLTANETTAGAVLELAPDVLGPLRSVTGSLAGIDRLTSVHPAMAVAAAGDIGRARALLPAIATAAEDLGKRCETPELSEVADKMRTLAAQPLPPVLDGLHGGMFVVNQMTLRGGVPERFDGYGAVHADHAAELVKLLAAKLPGLDLPLDGKAHPLPAAGLPGPATAAATSDTLAVGFGADSTKVTDLLGDKPAPAPLALVIFDYQRLGDLIPNNPNDPESADMKQLMRALGVLRMDLIVDERGLVAWMSFGLK